MSLDLVRLGQRPARPRGASRVTPMMALSGVRSSWLMLARNCDLWRLATSSSRPLSWISWNRRRVLDRDRGLRGERLEEVDGVGRDRLAADPVVGGEDADWVPTRDHRDDQEVLRPQGGESRVGRAQAEFEVAAVPVGVEQRRALAVRRGQRAGLPEGDGQVRQRLPLRPREAGSRPSVSASPSGVSVQTWRRSRRTTWRAASRTRASCSPSESGSCKRGREPLELLHVPGEALELSALRVDLAEQASVLDCEHGLGREGLEGGDDLGREGAALSSQNDQATEEPLLPDEREPRAVSACPPAWSVSDLRRARAATLPGCRRPGRARGSRRRGRPRPPRAGWAPVRNASRCSGVIVVRGPQREGAARPPRTRRRSRRRCRQLDGAG